MIKDRESKFTETRRHSLLGLFVKGMFLTQKNVKET